MLFSLSDWHSNLSTKTKQSQTTWAGKQLLNVWQLCQPGEIFDHNSFVAPLTSTRSREWDTYPTMSFLRSWHMHTCCFKWIAHWLFIHKKNPHLTLKHSSIFKSILPLRVSLWHAHKHCHMHIFVRKVVCTTSTTNALWALKECISDFLSSLMWCHMKRKAIDCEAFQNTPITIPKQGN